MEPADRWILGRLSAVIRTVTRSFERFQFGPAIDALYEFAWHEFADYYLELIKPRTQAGSGKGPEGPLAVATHVLDPTLRLLHPIMPFVTEELWQRLPHPGETLMFASWPEPDARFEDETLLKQMDHLLEVVRAIRIVRQDAQAGTGRASAHLESTHPLVRDEVGRRYVATLAQLDLNGSGRPGQERRVVVGETSVILRLGSNGPDAGASRQLRKELQKKENEIQLLKAKLANTDFLQKAPAGVVARERERLSTTERTVERLRDLLKSTDEVR